MSRRADGHGPNWQHGMDATPTYNSWHAAKKRCLNSHDKDYPRYGGAGITFCRRWMKFKNFLADMGVKPPGTMIDRRDGTKGYSLSNCRWATPFESANNKRNNTFLTFEGDTKTMAQWARARNMSVNALGKRIKDGWSVHETLTRPVRYRSDKKCH